MASNQVVKRFEEAFPCKGMTDNNICSAIKRGQTMQR